MTIAPANHFRPNLQPFARTAAPEPQEDDGTPPAQRLLPTDGPSASAASQAVDGARALGAVRAVETGAASRAVFQFTGIESGDKLPLRGGTVWGNGAQRRIAGGDVNVEEYGPERMKFSAKMLIDTGWFGIKVTRHLDADFKLLNDGMVRVDRLETDENGVPKPQDPRDPDRPQILEVISASPTQTVLRPRFAIEVHDGKEVRVPWKLAQPDMVMDKRPDNRLVITTGENVNGELRNYRFEVGLAGSRGDDWPAPGLMAHPWLHGSP